MKYWELLNVPGVVIEQLPETETTEPIAETKVIDVENVTEEPFVTSEKTIIDVELPTVDENPERINPFMNAKIEDPVVISESTSEQLKFDMDSVVTVDPDTYEVNVECAPEPETKSDKSVNMDAPESIPKEIRDTVLNDDEAGEILGTFKHYHKTYFPDIPIVKEIDKRFIFNLPKSIYSAHFDACHKYSLPPCLDPVFWMYLCMAKEPSEAIGNFVYAALTELNNNSEWLEAVEIKNDEYLYEDESDEKSDEVEYDEPENSEEEDREDHYYVGDAEEE